jgi:hypothetical protein
MAQIILDSANNLIQGDFDTATLSLRTRMQTSTTNATTGVYVVPNGSATSASVQVSNAADPTNASKVVVATNASTDTQIVSGANGSGSYLPLSFYTNNDIRFQMGNAGELNVRTAPGTVSSGTSGQFLTSGGPGAGVSWTTAAAGGFSNMTVFTSPGTFTTPATTTKIKVTVVGGGGAGGSGGPVGAIYGGGGGGGGSGGAAIYVGPVAASSPFAVTVGSAGNTSSFTTLASATGGSSGGSGGPGTANQNHGGAAGASGTGTAGTLLIKGTAGCVGTANSPVVSPSYSPSYGLGGTGGGSILAGGSQNTTAGGSYGGGGGGGPGTNSPGGGGGAGGAGVVIVEY